MNSLICDRKMVALFCYCCKVGDHLQHWIFEKKPKLPHKQTMPWTVNDVKKSVSANVGQKKLNFLIIKTPKIVSLKPMDLPKTFNTALHCNRF